MRRFFFSLALLIALTVPASAYDACGGPPERPELPADPATATEDDAKLVQLSNRDYGMDIGGYLTCQQLAEFDVRAEAERGERTAASADALQGTFRDQAADARGRQSGWRDDHERWIGAWERAHGKPAPPPPLTEFGD